LCGSENKQRLFHCTALTDWLVFITETECVYCAERVGSLNLISINLVFVVFLWRCSGSSYNCIVGLIGVCLLHTW